MNNTRAEICEYRGWIISFNTETESFYVQSDEYDRGETKKTFSSVKKYVDDFIKENNQFVPVIAERLEGGYGADSIKIIGIRKDERFIYEDEEGNKKQLSEYNEKYYILFNEENIKHKEKIRQLKIQIDDLHDEINNTSKLITGISISSIKEKYTV